MVPNTCLLFTKPWFLGLLPLLVENTVYGRIPSSFMAHEDEAKLLMGKRCPKMALYPKKMLIWRGQMIIKYQIKGYPDKPIFFLDWYFGRIEGTNCYKQQKGTYPECLRHFSWRATGPRQAGRRHNRFIPFLYWPHAAAVGGQHMQFSKTWCVGLVMSQAKASAHECPHGNLRSNQFGQTKLVNVTI